VLVDEARTLISGRSDQPPEKEMYETALATAAELREGEDFAIEGGERHTRLTASGKQKLAAAAEHLPGIFRGTRRREELATQALVATHVFKRDMHYLVRDDKVQIIDESTGRILPDRSWEQGLHQMVEAKEGCPLTSQQTSVARMTYQRFFRRYLRLAWMTGTAREIAPELWSVYRLPVVKVPTNRRSDGTIWAKRCTRRPPRSGERSWRGSASSTRPAGRCSSARGRWARPRI
jgi:preprotein translocase subunit SecA